MRVQMRERKQAAEAQQASAGCGGGQEEDKKKNKKMGLGNEGDSVLSTETAHAEHVDSATRNVHCHEHCLLIVLMAEHGLDQGLQCMSISSQTLFPGPESWLIAVGSATTDSGALMTAVGGLDLFSWRLILCHLGWARA